MKERFYVLLLVSIELEILGNKILVVLSLFGNLNLAHYFIVIGFDVCRKKNILGEEKGE